MSRKYKVLCVAATGMSGTTLLSRMLGRLPGFLAVGEVGYLWDKSLIDGRECGCGVRVEECSFWRPVGEEAFGGWGNVDAERATRLRRGLLFRSSFRYPLLRDPFALPFILHPGLSARYANNLRQYGDLHARLYDGIIRTSGAKVIVDSMKVPAHVYAVSRRPDLDVHVVHMVRDSRGVAYSNMKLVKRQGEGFRLQRRPSKTARRWLWINEAFQVLAKRGVPTTLVRYETFVRSPREELKRIARDVGVEVEDADLSFVSDEGVRLEQDHLVAGNRVRFQQGPILLRPDEEWETHLTPAQRRAVTLWTWPLLRRYGYALSPVD